MGNDTTHNFAPIAAAAMANRFQLLHGPYQCPKTRPGKKLFCKIRGTVIVAGFCFGLIPWPTTMWPNSRPVILCGDLVKAVQRESEVAVAHHFGVGIATVTMSRRALGVYHGSPRQASELIDHLKDMERATTGRRIGTGRAALAID